MFKYFSDKGIYGLYQMAVCMFIMSQHIGDIWGNFSWK